LTGGDTLRERTVIIGAGHGAGQLVASLLQKHYDGEIVLIGDEPHYPYQRPPLSKKFLAGEMSAERLYYKPPSFYDNPSVDLRLGTKVASIDRDARAIVDDSGAETDYDNLVLATGARVRRLDAPGATLEGIHYLRNIADVSAMREQMHKGARIVIVGAGYIGLEVAAVSHQLGLDVTVIEMADRVMSRVVCAEVSDFYQAEHVRQGVKLLLSATLEGFSGDGHVDAVNVADGPPVPADLVLIGIGVIPNTELAKDAGLNVDNGIVVDNRCRCSVPGIYALGDCTNHPNELLQRRLRLESVHNALEQAKTVAANICGENVAYAQVPWFWSDQYDLKLQIAGLSDGHDEIVIRGDPATRSFACAYLREGQLLALDAINSPKDFMQSKALIAAGARVPSKTLADTAIALRDML